MQSNRLASGGLVDRTRPIRFQFNGQTLQGYAGDTLASALLANNVQVVGRSFKYHRPRGIYTAGSEEPNALIQAGVGDRTEPNLKATQIELTEGLIAASVNCWPSPRFDIRGVNQLFAGLLPAGFYYKTFMRPSWHTFEDSIRRAAGLGISPTVSDPDRYDASNLTCEVLVVGGGPAGLAAAVEAAKSGERVVLVDDQDHLGGSLLWRPLNLREGEARSWVDTHVQQLTASPNVTLLTRTTVSGYYDHNALVAVERRVSGTIRQRLWKLRAQRVVLATGATERPLVFPGNDRPGVMLADAALQYLRRYGVRCGQNIVLFANNNLAYSVALAFKDAGVRVAAIVDPAQRPAHRLYEQARSAGIPVLTGALVEATHGWQQIKAVTVKTAKGRERIACDLLLTSGGWSPTVHLHSQSGGTVKYDEPRAMFVPDRAAQAVVSVGAANGDMTFGASDAYEITPVWGAAATQGKAFVDLASDVTASDVALAARENYISVEHLKRYTTLGMGVDQGRTSNVNGLAIMGELTGRRPPEVGTTRFRPPFSPITLGAIAGAQVGELFRPLKYLPAHNWHMERGAVCEEFGGWLRPTAYPLAGEHWEAAALREARAVRKGIGVIDGSPLGKIEVIGRDAATFLDRMYVGTASTLQVGRARYGLMLSENGVIIDDGVFVRLEANRFLVHTTSAGAERINDMFEDWLQCEWPDLDVVLVPVTTQWATITVSGPRARELLATLSTDIDLGREAFPHMSVRQGTLEGMPARICRISFTGELSYEISIPARQADPFARKLWSVGEAFGLVAYGIEALMMLRTEKGYLHVGVDTDGTTLPGDVGFGSAVGKKASDFAGRRSLTRPASRSEGRLHFVGLSSQERIPIGAQVIDGPPPCLSQGHVTTSYLSPTLSEPIALAMVRNGRERMDEEITLHHMGKTVRARIVSPVFFDPSGERLHG